MSRPPATDTGHGPLLAVDVGTTMVKAGVFDVAGGLLGLGRRPQRDVAIHVGWHEHDPEQTLAAVSEAVTEAVRQAGTVPADITAVAVTGPRGTFAAAAPDGRPLTNFITWQDQRAAGEGPPSGVDADTHYDICGSNFDPSTVLPKYLWLRAHQPDLIAGTAQLVTPQGFVLACLGAEQAVSDTSAAAHFGLLDVSTNDWSSRLLEAYAVERSVLPSLAPPGAVVGTTGSSTAQQLGLSGEARLVAAGSDGICSELGAGVLSEGQVYGYLGTATAVAGPTGRLSLDPERNVIVMPGSVPGRWRGLGLAMAGASALDWFGRVSGTSLPYAIPAHLQASPPGARGVRFIPTLAGSGSAFRSPQARGSFVGLSLSADVADMTRAVLEGVALELRWMLTSLPRVGINPAAVHLTGGGSRSDGWAQVVADATQLPVLRIDHPEPGLLGAALYARAAFTPGASVIDAAGATSTPATRFSPRRELAELYEDAARVYADVRRSFAANGIDAALFAAGDA